MIQTVRGSFLIEHSAFERIRQKLLSNPGGRELDKVLRHWARPTDRSLPMAFLGRTLGELVRTPFEQLKLTRGIGPKKIKCLIELFERAASDLETGQGTRAVGLRPAAELDCSTSDVSPTEAIWGQWRAAVVAHGLSSITLGRLAGSLRDLPRPMWNTPLASYVNLTLEETSRLHTHGERRLATILQIFRTLFELLGEQDPTGHLSVTVEPKFVRRLDGWTKHWLNSRQSPDQDEVRSGFVAPILEQLRIDAGEFLEGMAVAYIDKLHPGLLLSLAGRRQTDVGPTWYYLDKMQAIIRTRWAEGADRVDDLVRQLESRSEQPAGLALLQSSIDVFLGSGSGQMFPAGDRSHAPVQPGPYHPLASTAMAAITRSL